MAPWYSVLTLRFALAASFHNLVRLLSLSRFKVVQKPTSKFAKAASFSTLLLFTAVVKFHTLILDRQHCSAQGPTAAVLLDL